MSTWKQALFSKLEPISKEMHISEKTVKLGHILISEVIPHSGMKLELDHFQKLRVVILGMTP